ncbi:MAG: hypothetical protein KGQ41_07880 [Alphaproteobacteria bacterium]|nr:hypothetical protein [Alphaproteobacteria bacterium]
MDEIKQRLSTASEACIKAYEAWRAKAADHAARESLQEAVHELRKVAARLEIELAVSDRKAQGSEPIPIPSHRASRRQGAPEMEGGDDDNRANRMPPAGGGQQGGGQRRPMQQHMRRQGGEGSTPTENAGNEAPATTGGDDDGQRKVKPLSLRRSSASEGEQG